MRTISNSEASAWLQCRMKYYFAHVLCLEPKRYSDALVRGILGHEILAEYYATRKNGEIHSYAVQVAMKLFMEIYTDERYADSEEMLMGLRALLSRYWIFIENENWEILAVEKKYELPINGEYSYGLRLDLAARIDGEVTCVDHKFVYDFWSHDDLILNPQLPKYIGALRATQGVKISRGMVNQLRHRMKKGGNTDDELFRRTPIRYTDKQIRGFLKEQILVSEEITEYRSLSQDQQFEKSRRTLNKMTCKNCSFQSPCLTSLAGEDITLMLQTNYQPNTYEYNPEDKVGAE